jgi:hypothetical protein
MRIDLIYQEWDNSESSESSFNRIEQIVKNSSVDIVCPYLSLDIVERVTELADSWRLITDTSEWLRTQSKREEIQEFIHQNSDRIHDCRNLHAKVILTKDSAIVGSANFTRTGLTENSEMSVHFQQTRHIDELQNWVNELWKQTKTVDGDALTDYAEDMEPVKSGRKSSVSMPDTGPTHNTTLDFLKPETTVEDSGYQRLVDRAAQAPSREWINTYFDLMAEVIEIAGLDEDDASISTSIPKSDPPRLPVNVNQRYVLTAYPETGVIGIMLPVDSKAVDILTEYISDFGTFNTSSKEDPYWFEFLGDPQEYITKEMKQDWERAIKNELDRSDGSPHRKDHRPSAYKAAVSQTYREKVLKEAFKIN